MLVIFWQIKDTESYRVPKGAHSVDEKKVDALKEKKKLLIRKSSAMFFLKKVLFFLLNFLIDAF